MKTRTKTASEAASLSARRAWIEIAMRRDFKCLGLSLSARRAWIEMLISGLWMARSRVALRKESVDRNNVIYLAFAHRAVVALRKESVDRNFDVGNSASARPRSLSARRAWIEMLGWLRTLEVTRSLSARRAWIEMPIPALPLWFFLGRSPQGERG